MDLAGDLAIVGASGEDADVLNTGAAYIYRHDGLSWTRETRLSPALIGGNARFGSSVDLDVSQCELPRPGNHVVGIGVR